MRSLLFYFLSLFCLGISASANACLLDYAADTTITSLRFINEYVVPHNQYFKKTTIGGLSGIDYDKKRDIYYIISDDRSDINPARFYTAKIHLSDRGIDTIEFKAVHTLLHADGKPYPSSKVDAHLAPDPEAIRFNARTQQLVWVSEGERIQKSGVATLSNPTITIAGLQGEYHGSFAIPQNLFMHSLEKGPRQNGSLEGVTFNSTYNYMYVALEEPLYEDGPRADVTPTKSWVRIYRYDLNNKNNDYQYAYLLEPVAFESFPRYAYKVNGVSEILFLAENQLLTVERSFSTGRVACPVKVFLTDLTHAKNIKDVESLRDNPPTHAARKKLLLNMDDLGIYIDNIEGVTFGPDLPNGNKTLIFISDNNFKSFEKTQFLLFEIIP